MQVTVSAKASNKSPGGVQEILTWYHKGHNSIIIQFLHHQKEITEKWWYQSLRTALIPVSPLFVWGDVGACAAQTNMQCWVHRDMLINT